MTNLPTTGSGPTAGGPGATTWGLLGGAMVLLLGGLAMMMRRRRDEI